MITVAIHQPNYQPWLGFFNKLSRCDHFVLLDHVQYSKNNIINRTRILADGVPRWLTVPVHVNLGDPISAVKASAPDWPVRHLSTLRNAYRRAAAFRAVWPDVEELYADLPAADLAVANQSLIVRLAKHLDISTPITQSSAIDVFGLPADDVLVAIVRAIAPDGGRYLSGQGGRKYQDPRKFEAAGVALTYTDFMPEPYDQGTGKFEPGLSLLDALFHTGWDGIRRMLAGTR